jgi:hypothetical protein
MSEEKSIEKTLYETLLNSSELEYGSTFKRSRVLDIMGIEDIEFGTQKEFQVQELAELSGIGYMRNILINQGKWIIRKGETYRILHPSENSSQIDSFMRSGSNAYLKASKLAKSTDPRFLIEHDQLAAKIQSRRKAAKYKAILNRKLDRKP